MAKKKMTLEEAIVKDFPYEVPKNWVWSKLGVITDIKTGRKDANHGTEDGKYPFYTCASEPIKSPTYSFDGEYVILPGNGANVGMALYHKGKFEAYQRTYVLNSAMINTKYVLYNLQFRWKDYNENKQYGSATNYIKLGNITEYEIAIPPLKEQQRIVDKIESLFEKLDKAKELIEEARDDFEKRKSAILEKAFRGELTKKWRAKNKGKILNEIELFNQIKESRFSLITSNKEKREIESIFNDYKFIDQTLPDGWIKLKSSMVCALISCGKTPTGKISDKGEVAYLKVYNIVNNKIDFEYKPQFIDYETHSTKLKNSMLRPNDVIMNIVGPPLKKIAIIPETYEHWNINQALVRFRTIDCINYKYYYYCLLYDDTLKKVINSTRGVVGQANISVSQARDLDIIIPSLEEQKEIVRILDKLLEEEAKIEELTKLEEQIELIKKSILAKAFRGQLGTNSEDDESAIELLKEILNK